MPYKDSIKNRECMRKWRNDNKVYKAIIARKSHLKTEYGITQDQYNTMFNAQNGCCAICSRHQSQFKVSLSVDHCHKTNAIRGLLCRSCDTATGLLQESSETLNKANEYLNRSKNVSFKI